MRRATAAGGAAQPGEGVLLNLPRRRRCNCGEAGVTYSFASRFACLRRVRADTWPRTRVVRVLVLVRAALAFTLICFDFFAWLDFGLRFAGFLVGLDDFFVAMLRLHRGARRLPLT